MMIIDWNTAHLECESEADTDNQRCTDSLSQKFQKYSDHDFGKHSAVKLPKIAITETE
jgi:hypothetical protein